MRFLATLSPADLACGFAELVKLAIVRDPALFETCRVHGSQMVASRFLEPAVIAQAAILDATEGILRELAGDPFEDVHERILDFGHTFSPGIEVQSNYTVRHGEAVGLDILLSACISEGRGLCSGLVQQLVTMFRSVGLPTHLASVPAMELWESLADIRAHRDGRLNLVLPEGRGRTRFVQSVDLPEIARGLSELERYSHADE